MGTKDTVQGGTTVRKPRRLFEGLQGKKGGTRVPALRSGQRSKKRTWEKTQELQEEGGVEVNASRSGKKEDPVPADKRMGIGRAKLGRKGWGS